MLSLGTSSPNSSTSAQINSCSSTLENVIFLKSVDFVAQRVVLGVKNGGEIRPLKQKFVVSHSLYLKGSKTAGPFLTLLFEFILLFRLSNPCRPFRRPVALEQFFPFQESPPPDMLSAEDAAQVSSVFVTELTTLSAVSQM